MIRRFTFALLAVAAGQAMAVDHTPGPTDSEAALRSAVHASVPACAGGLEHILPGQYYFCAAVRDFGRGNDGEARARLHDAAFWASKPAEYVLGLMTFNGEHIPANRPLGVAWLALAAERHDQRFEPSFARAYLSLTPDERTQANVYWADLRQNYADATAGHRAWVRYSNELRNIQAAAMFGGSIFIDGTMPPGITPDSDDAARSNFGELSSVSGESAFSGERMITRSGDELFQGMEGHVTVGDTQMSLVPIGGAVAKGSDIGH